MRNPTMYWTLTQHIEHPLENPPQPSRLLTPKQSVFELCLQKAIPSLCSGRLLQDGGEHGRTSSLSLFSGHKIGFLVRSKAVLNTVMVDKALCKPTDGGFGRTIMCKNKYLS